MAKTQTPTTTTTLVTERQRHLDELRGKRERMIEELRAAEQGIISMDVSGNPRAVARRMAIHEVDAAIETALGELHGAQKAEIEQRIAEPRQRERVNEQRIVELLKQLHAELAERAAVQAEIIAARGMPRAAIPATLEPTISGILARLERAAIPPESGAEREQRERRERREERQAAVENAERMLAQIRENARFGQDISDVEKYWRGVIQTAKQALSELG